MLLELTLTSLVLAGAANPLAPDSGGAPAAARHWERPPAGWNAWFAFDKSVTQEGILRNAEALVRTGLRDAGCALGPSLHSLVNLVTGFLRHAACRLQPSPRPHVLLTHPAAPTARRHVRQCRRCLGRATRP